MKSFALMQLGCKVNDFEATYVKNELSKEYEYVNFKEKADIYIIFSCCVTNTAEAKTRKFIHQARRKNENAYIAVVGCLAQIKPDLKEFDDVDLIVGSQDKDKIVTWIKDGLKINSVHSLDNPDFENLYLNKYPGKDRAFLKVQDGCNQFCSYCIIPYARGRERSGKHEELLLEAKELAKNFKEIVLTGIHTGRYNDNGYNLYNLLSDLIQIEGIETIRLSSIEITEISDDIIDLIASSNKIAKHLHIPVQSCSNRILKSMNRPYMIEDFIKRIEYIRNKVNNICISTDLIVGYPGEDDECFLETINNLRIINFSFIHVFPYSRKKDTVADRLPNHIDGNVKKARVNEVIKLQSEISNRVYKAFVGKIVEVLIEKNIHGKSYGYSKQYFYVELDGLFNVGDIVKAIIISIDDNIKGEYVSN